MKLIKTIMILAFLFVPIVGAYSVTLSDNELLTIGLPSKPLPGEEAEDYGESEQSASEEDDDDNSEEEEDGFNDSEAKDTEDFEDWYEPDPAYQ